MEMHAEAGQPLEVFHIGGDEIPRTALQQSPKCEAYSLPLNPEPEPELEPETEPLTLNPPPSTLNP